MQREAIHLTDQFAAFGELMDEGCVVENIVADYCNDMVTLEQLMALAITEAVRKQSK